MRVVLWFVIVMTVGAAEPPATLAELYDQHRWFELRTRPGPPPFFAGAIAGSFNDWPEARRQLLSVIDSRIPLARVEEAYHLLINVSLRRGAYREAASLVDRGAGEFSSVAGLKPLVKALSVYDEQSVVQRGAGTFPREPQREGLSLPLTIEGLRSTYVVDTGANFCVMTRSEADRRKMKVEDVNAGIENSAGQRVQFQIAVAREVEVGSFRIANVAFLVFDDGQQPFNEMPAHSRGALGIPLLLALERLSWMNEAVEVGRAKARTDIATKDGPPNMAFDGLYPVVGATVANRAVTLVLDSGARTTHLWQPLWEEVPDLRSGAIQQRAKESHGVGGTAKLENVRLPVVSILLGGREVRLAPAHLYLTATTAQSRYYHGNLGRDLLAQARRVTVDFEAMRLTLE